MKTLASGLVLSLLFMAAQVSGAVIQNEPFTAEVGIYHNWTSGVQARDGGVRVAGASNGPVGTGGCSTGALMSQTGNVSSTSITSGHYVQSVNVTLRDVSLSSACFNVTVAFNGAGLTPLYLKTSNSPVLSDFATCQFDLGTTIASGSYSIEVTVQQV